MSLDDKKLSEITFGEFCTFFNNNHSILENKIEEVNKLLKEIEYAIHSVGDSAANGNLGTETLLEKILELLKNHLS